MTSQKREGARRATAVGLTILSTSLFAKITEFVNNKGQSIQLSKHKYTAYSFIDSSFILNL